MKNQEDYKELVNWGQYFPDDENKLGQYLSRSGRPVNCRLDFRITTLAELKKCAVVVSELNKKLNKFAYEVEGDHVLRVMLARQVFENSQFQLRYINPTAVLKKAKEKLAAQQALKRAEKLKKMKPVVDLGEVNFGGVSEAQNELDIPPSYSTKRGSGK
jgi:hypothetical protein